jgi:glucose-6-phosphate-specific signal transduction histidine kinase
MKVVFKNEECTHIEIDRKSLIWLRKYARDHDYTLREALYHIMRKVALEEHGMTNQFNGFIGTK